MRIIDWNCKRCGEPLPDKPAGESGDYYVLCPQCGSKHMVMNEGPPVIYQTYQERNPWPQWGSSGAAGPIGAYDDQTIIS